MKVKVLFSGGLDSTYLIYDNLVKGNHVYPIYVSVVNNAAKAEREKKAAELIWDKLEEKFKGTKGSLDEIQFATHVEIQGLATGLRFTQPPMWILGVLFTDLSGVDEIQIGYVMNDDAISFLDEISQIYNSYKPLMYNCPRLTFPLKQYNKSALWNGLPDDIRQLTIFCESPTNGDCGGCTPCRRYKFEELFYKYERNQDQDYQQKLKTLHSGLKGPTRNSLGRQLTLFNDHIETLSMPEDIRVLTKLE